MTWSQWLFDLPLALVLLLLAWRLVTSPDLFKATVLFIAFGLLMALAWVRLHAVDIALAETAIGAGVTGALFVSALNKMNGEQHKDQGDPLRLEGSALSLRRKGGLSSASPMIILLLVVLTGFLGWAIVSLPVQGTSLRTYVLANIAHSGVHNPVTAVLLNFRGYDTLLEITVLFAAALAVWSLGTVQIPEPVQTAAPFLTALLQVLLPAMVLTAGYLLWVGAHAPGGAFQAGAVLGGAGILLLLAEVRLASPVARWPLRTALTAGVSVFTAVGLGSMMLGGRLLEYPRGWAGTLILLIESAAALSIGITLMVLFIGGRPSEADGGVSLQSHRQREEQP
jgi:multisubunit Na+/H+ antiporter MnhB subunit